VDETWIDPGERREAFYTNLGPGRYRFRVIASNNDGIWNRAGATLAIEIQPTFFQTWWFLLLCLLPAIALARLLYAMRLRQFAIRVRHQMETRIAERERIARELHDTLLQSFQGVTMFFQSVVDRFPPGSELRGAIEKGLDLADDALAEGRARVRELRNATYSQGFTKIVGETAAAIIDRDTPRLDVTTTGSPRPLADLVNDELLRIAQEAIRNAVQHADAKSIEIAIDYGLWRLSMVVRDDGTGIPASVLESGSRSGHYGIVGMRERATRIGARFALAPRAGGGTAVLVSVPARLAYRDGLGLLDRLRPRLWRGRVRDWRAGRGSAIVPPEATDR
jgi:signal transduction histidine kinase